MNKKHNFMKTKTKKFNQEIEDRIEMQIIVDTYDESEAAMGLALLFARYHYFSFQGQMHQKSQHFTIIAK